MEGQVILHIGLALGGLVLLVANVRAIKFWRNFNPPPLKWSEWGPRLAMYGTFGAVAIGAFSMTLFGLIGLLI